MPAVSIVIPVYNTQESALRRCLDSVLNQEYKDLELIAVDDGSTKNNAAEVLDEYAAKDERVKVIHKKNGGVSSARNAAFAVMSGTYVQFMDSDDWIPDDSTKNLVRTAEEKNADLVVADFYRVVGNNLSAKGSIRDNGVLTLQEYAEHMMETPADYYYGVLWNKLYRTEIIKGYSMVMDEDLHWCEDFVFNLEYLLHTERIAPLQIPVYYYVKTEGSLVAQSLNLTNTVQMKMNMFRYYNDFYKNIFDEEKYRSQRLAIAGFLIGAATDDPVIPMLPGTKKVGEESVHADFRSEHENIVTGAYYIGKLHEKYLNSVAMKYELELKDAKVAAALKETEGELTLKELADYTGLSRFTITASLEKMMRRGLITISYEKGICAELSAGAKGFSADLDQALQDIDAVLFAGVTEEEKEMWMKMSGRMMDNLRNALPR